VDIPEVGRLTVRPIRPEDAPLLTALFETLSPRSVYLRFFSPLKRLPHHMLARFTQIDYDREMALVAVQDPEGGEEKMLGVARVIPEPGGRTAEFAVLVGDPWQGKGIGANLLRRVIDIARDRGVEKIYGIVLSENTHMLALGKRLGFRLRRVPDTSDYELTLTCTTPLPADGPGTPGTVPAS
jgi:acetyltransferase